MSRESKKRSKNSREASSKAVSCEVLLSSPLSHHEGQDLLVEELVVGLAAVVLGGGLEVGEEAGAVEGLRLVFELAEAADDAREETPDVVALRRLTRRLRGGRRGLPRLRREEPLTSESDSSRSGWRLAVCRSSPSSIVHAAARRRRRWRSDS